MEIYAVKLEECISSVIFTNILSYFPVEKQEKIKRFRKNRDAQRALIAEALIRSIIISSLGLKNEQIIFEIGECGKPYLREIEDFHFNISHSGEWVVCAVSNKPVGIDIETIKEIKFDIAQRFFSKEEAEFLLSVDEKYRLGYFFDLWTLKESYIKADGKGLSIPLDSFSFEIRKDQIRFTTKNELTDCFFKQYSISQEYKLSVCSLEDKFPDSIILRDIYEIYTVMKNS